VILEQVSLKSRKVDRIIADVRAERSVAKLNKKKAPRRATVKGSCSCIRWGYSAPLGLEAETDSHVHCCG
jgi:hypothetical protein